VHTQQAQHQSTIRYLTLYSAEQTPIQDRHDGEPSTDPKTHHQQLGHRNPSADNKIHKQTAHHTTRFQLHTVRHRLHRTYNTDTTQPNDRNYTSTGATAPKQQSRGSKSNTRLSRTTHAQLDDNQQHTRIANDDQLTVSQHSQYMN